MLPEKMSELEARASAAGLTDELKSLEARSRVLSEIERMKTEGSVLELSPEERDMLVAFRRFKARMTKRHERFSWLAQIGPGIEVVADTAFVRHPSET